MKFAPQLTRIAIVTEGGEGPIEDALGVAPGGAPNLIRVEGAHLDGGGLTLRVGPGAGVAPAGVAFGECTILERGPGTLLGLFTARGPGPTPTGAIVLAVEVGDEVGAATLEVDVACVSALDGVAMSSLYLNSPDGPGFLYVSTVPGQYAANQVIINATSIPPGGGTSFGFTFDKPGFSTQPPTNVGNQPSQVTGTIGVNYTEPAEGDPESLPGFVTTTVTLTNKKYLMPPPQAFPPPVPVVVNNN